MDQHPSLRDALNSGADNLSKTEEDKPGTAPSNGPAHSVGGQSSNIVPYNVADAPPPPESLTPPSSWLAQNGLSLVATLGLLGFLVYYFDLSGLISIAKAALGLSLVIFIHELGHFLVAKWCDVHVTTFSIGFGPAVPGCSFQWGETTYKLAMFPLGGYVQMVGQVDGDESSDGSEDDPRSYRNKGVWQRMAIISAGVIMNVILAVVCFVAVFLGPGKDRSAPVISFIDVGSPAFKQGMRSGDRIVEIGGYRHPYFEDVKRWVMATSAKEELDLVLRHDSQERHVGVVPRKESKDLAPMIGFAPTSRLQLAYKRYLSSTMLSPARTFSPAADANPPFEYGDRIIESSYDPEHPDKVKPLPRDPRFPRPGEPDYPGYEQCDYFEFARRMQDMAGLPVTLVVEREKDEGIKQTVKIVVQPAYSLSIGTVMRMGEITAIRTGSPADGNIHARNEEKSLAGDKIVGVSCETATWGEVPAPANDKGVEKRILDPMKLPMELRKEMVKVKGERKKLTLHVDRTNDMGPRTTRVQVSLDWQDDWTYDRAEPMTQSSPWAIPELGLAYLVKSTVEAVGTEISANPLKVNDEIKKFKITYRTEKGEGKADSWTDLGSEEWAWFYSNLFVSGLPVMNVAFKVSRPGEPNLDEVVLEPAVDKAWPINDRGWILMPDYRRQKADNVFDAISLGFKDTHNSIIQVLQTLKGMIRGRLSVKILGGPLTIASTAYRIAGVDFWEFVFFLGLISVNLAVINFLPIPVLDGGHMVFLIYEKIRGQPASEAIRAGATYIGLLLILCLMFFVLYLDVTRLFW